MDSEDAVDVAVDCVEHVGQHNVRIQDVLEKVGISRAEALDDLKDEIIGKTRGVGSKGFTIKRSALSGMAIDWTVNKVADVIERESKPIEI